MNVLTSSLSKTVSSLRGSSSCRAVSSLHRIDPIQESLLEEQCILVDSTDQRVGVASKKACHLIDPSTGKSPLHRAFSLFVFNNEKQLLLQQRSDVKVTFPGMWTNTCCSHPLATPSETVTARDGEGVRKAAQRRIQSELGVSPDDCPADGITYLTRVLYSAPSSGKWGENEMDYILFLRSKQSNITLRPNWNEVKNVKYISKDELADFVKRAKEDGSGVTPWFEFIANSLLPKWWDNLDKLDDFKNHIDIVRF